MSFSTGTIGAMIGGKGQHYRRPMKAGDEIMEPDHHADRAELPDGQRPAEQSEGNNVGDTGRTLVGDGIKTGRPTDTDPALDRTQQSPDGLIQERPGNPTSPYLMVASCTAIRS